MARQNWILGAVLVAVLAALIAVVGGPGWAVGLGLVGGFLIVLLTFGLRE